jgi:hypothetical protein
VDEVEFDRYRLIDVFDDRGVGTLRNAHGTEMRRNSKPEAQFRRTGNGK